MAVLRWRPEAAIDRLRAFGLGNGLDGIDRGRRWAVLFRLCLAAFGEALVVENLRAAKVCRRGFRVFFGAAKVCRRGGFPFPPPLDEALNMLFHGHTSASQSCAGREDVPTGTQTRTTF